MKETKTMKKILKTVMCFGTFDVLHLGHLDYFNQAKQYGDHLIVVIARDTTKADQKKTTIFNEDERLELVKQLTMVDEAVLGYPDDHLRIILEKHPDVLCLGYDQQVEENDLKEKLQAAGLRAVIHRMNPYKPLEKKSSLIKKKILESQ